MTLPEKLRAAAEIEMNRWGGPAKLLKEAADALDKVIVYERYSECPCGLTDTARIQFDPATGEVTETLS